MLVALRALGIPVPHMGPGPFWALRDGNRMLEKFDKALVEVDFKDLRRHHTFFCFPIIFNMASYPFWYWISFPNTQTDRKSVV